MLVEQGFDQSLDTVREKLSNFLHIAKDVDTKINVQKIMDEVNQLPAWLRINPFIAMQKLEHMVCLTNQI